MGKFEHEIMAVSAEYVTDITDQAQENGGFVAFDHPDQYKELLRHCIVRQRGQLEEDPSFKQIIPYLVLVHEDKVFYYIRPGAINEQRLANKVSIGVGGHVDTEDVEHADQVIRAAAEREAREEVGEAIHIDAMKPLGFIYTDATEVDRVHLGILLLGKVSDASIRVKDDEIGQHGFITGQQIRSLLQDKEFTFENWSIIAWNKVQEYLGLGNEVA